MGRGLKCSVAAGALVMGMSAGSASAQSPPKPEPKADDGRDVIVVGVRGSVDAATKRKRTSKQIKESVVAEDAGKLPDNNVPQAISRITGVQITRSVSSANIANERGNGNNVSIRGVSDIQTTINGNQTNLGTGRSLNLSDIPAELIKAVDVYKTRTADQVDGGVGGTVNVELRRPLDLKKGLTVAGSLRGAYDNYSKKTSPSGSVLIADRFQLGGGEIGLLVNGSIRRELYRMNFDDSESPGYFCCGDAVPYTTANPAGANITAGTARDQLPDALKNSFLPYRIQYGYERGDRTYPSLNLAVQWKPSPRVDFVLEGGYVGARENRNYDRIFAVPRDFGAQVVPGSVTLLPNGAAVRTVTTQNRPNPAGPPGRLLNYPGGPDSQYIQFRSNLYTSNFETHYHGDGFTLNASVQYNESQDDTNFIELLTRFKGQDQISFNFANPIYPRGIPTFVFQGVNLADPNAYLVDRFHDEITTRRNKEFAAQSDLDLKLSDDRFLRSLQVGFRFSARKVASDHKYRDGSPVVDLANGDNTPIPLSEFPGFSAGMFDGPDFAGNPQRWLHIPGPTLYQNLPAIRALLIAKADGGAAAFSSPEPLSALGDKYTSREKSFAYYGQLNVAGRLGVPIDGTVGVRATTTWGVNTSTAFTEVAKDPTDRSKGVTVVTTPSTGRGNYLDILPTANLIAHVTKTLQVRLSYSTNVQRPDFYDLRDSYYSSIASINAGVPTYQINAGNPNLKPQRSKNYDLSIEQYFSNNAFITGAAYYRTISDTYYQSTLDNQPLAAFGHPGSLGSVTQLRNAGTSTYAGVESAFQAYFGFLPKPFRHLGLGGNISYLFKARTEFPFPEDFPGAYDAVGSSKLTYNVSLIYDSPAVSARLAYNYRSRWRDFIWAEHPDYSFYNDATRTLDAAFNYTPVKAFTLSIEATNLTKADNYKFFGTNRLLPLGVTSLPRTIQASIRFRY